MGAKDVRFGDDARQRMLAGVNILAEAVQRPTLGKYPVQTIYSTLVAIQPITILALS